MPLNPPVLASGFITPNLISTGNLGTGVPRLAMGIAIGVCQYLTAQSKVTSVDVGTAGVGATFFPLIVPPPLLLGSLTSAFASTGILGIAAPQFIAGLTTALTTGWTALAFLQITHPMVGVGTGVAKIVGPSAVTAMVTGFSAMGMAGAGPAKMATAIGLGLDSTFASFVQVAVPIVGTPSPVGSSGIGFGTVI